MITFDYMEKATCCFLFKIRPNYTLCITHTLKPQTNSIRAINRVLQLTGTGQPNCKYILQYSNLRALVAVVKHLKPWRGEEERKKKRRGKTLFN